MSTILSSTIDQFCLNITKELKDEAQYDAKSLKREMLKVIDVVNEYDYATFQDEIDELHTYPEQVIIMCLISKVGFCNHILSLTPKHNEQYKMDKRVFDAQLNALLQHSVYHAKKLRGIQC
jgi:hypothetical protein